MTQLDTELLERLAAAGLLETRPMLKGELVRRRLAATRERVLAAELATALRELPKAEAEQRAQVETTFSAPQVPQAPDDVFVVSRQGFANLLVGSYQRDGHTYRIALRGGWGFVPRAEWDALTASEPRFLAYTTGWSPVAYASGLPHDDLVRMLTAEPERGKGFPGPVGCGYSPEHSRNVLTRVLEGATHDAAASLQRWFDVECSSSDEGAATRAVAIRRAAERLGLELDEPEAA